MDLKETIKALSRLPAPSGREEPAAERILELLRPNVDETRTDAMGNVFGLRRCGREGAPTLLLEAHMDEVGFVVTAAEEGFLKFSAVGGIDPRLLPGREVTVLAPEGPLYGVIACLPPHVLSAAEREKAVKIPELYIDAGLTQEEAEKRVPPGSFGVFVGEPFDLAGDFLCGKALDDRLCVAILLQVMEALKGVPLGFDICFMAATQEEVGSRGASAGVFSAAPDYCIALDVTHAVTPDASAGPEVFEAGCGAVIDVGPNMNRRMSDALLAYCREKGIPYKVEVDPGHTGTDAWPIQIAREGVCTGLLSVPLRYMHSPVECVKLSDAETTVRLLTGFLSEAFEGGVLRA